MPLDTTDRRAHSIARDRPSSYDAAMFGFVATCLCEHARSPLTDHALRARTSRRTRSACGKRGFPSTPRGSVAVAGTASERSLPSRPAAALELTPSSFADFGIAWPYFRRRNSSRRRTSSLPCSTATNRRGASHRGAFGGSAA